MRLLLDKGADINLPGGEVGKGVTPLHMAVYYNCTSAAEFLMEAGASVEAMFIGPYGRPVHQASFRGNLRLLERLLVLDVHDEKTLTHALEIAIGRDMGCVRALIRVGATPSRQALYLALFWNCPQSFRALVEAGADVRSVDDSGETLLHRVRKLEAARLLLDEAPDLVHVRNGAGRTPLGQLRHWMRECINYGVQDEDDINKEYMPLVSLLESRMQ
jgi:ankyrin repeat protein